MLPPSTLISALTAGFILCGTRFLQATELRVEPVLLEMNAPSVAGSLTIQNEDKVEVSVQTRILRWSQADGKETLEPTSDVVASPPTIKLAPQAENIVRVVRVSKQPVIGEESYRVIVDQLPNLRARQNNTINILVRQSIPVFFRAAELAPPSVSWSYRHEAGKLVIYARNSGEERLRIANLRIDDGAGHSLNFGNGLAGYALGRSTMSWIFNSAPNNFGLSGSASITAQSDKGPVHAVAQIRDRL
jgi:fimbrial chaperone protein